MGHTIWSPDSQVQFRAAAAATAAYSVRKQIKMELNCSCITPLLSSIHLAIFNCHLQFYYSHTLHTDWSLCSPLVKSSEHLYTNKNISIPMVHRSRSGFLSPSMCPRVGRAGTQNHLCLWFLLHSGSALGGLRLPPTRWAGQCFGPVFWRAEMSWGWRSFLFPPSHLEGGKG